MKNSGVHAQPFNKAEMLTYVQKSGGKIIANKGATFYAVATAVCKLCKILTASTDTVSTVSTMMHGEYGIEDVCLNTLALVGPNGCQGKIEVNLTDEEVALLHKSANTLKEVISQIEI